MTNTSDHLSLQSQRLAVIADRTLRTENQLERMARDLSIMRSILRDLERRDDK
ncbi:hypothetical protein [Brevibacterium sediminis]